MNYELREEIFEKLSFPKLFIHPTSSKQYQDPRKNFW